MASSLTKRLQTLNPWLRAATHQLRFARTESGPSRRRSKSPSFPVTKTAKEKSDWWIVDGEMHEIGDHVPLRERFVIPRDNIPNKRRKQLREQFMRRTRLVIKESEHEVWCKRYMELYQELRENWERLYWDEGYSKKIAQDHANYDSAEEDDQDFNPYRFFEAVLTNLSVSFRMILYLRSLIVMYLIVWRSSRRSHGDQTRDQGFRRDGQGDTWEKVNQIRDKFEYDRERRMREKAFAPMNGGTYSDLHGSNPHSENQPFDTQRYFQTERN